MTIGASSTLTVGGADDYVQAGGTTILAAATSGLAVATGQQVNIQGGLLEGVGTIAGNLINAGTVHPGLSPGTLTVVCSYTRTAAGALNIDLAGGTPGSGYSVLSIFGTAALDGTLNVSLLNGFVPFDGETFTILTDSNVLASVPVTGTFSAFHVFGAPSNVTFTIGYFPNDVILDAHVGQSVVPEPASVVMLGLGLAGVGAFASRRSLRRRKAGEGATPA